MSSRQLPLLVAVCVLVLGTVAVLAVAALPGHRRVPARAVVPAQFPDYSPLTAPLATHPVGAALAVYRQDAAGGLSGSTQTLVLGADGRSTRRLPQALARGGWSVPAAAVLSPDGRTVAVGDGPSAGDPATAQAAPVLRALPPGRVSSTSPSAAPDDADAVDALRPAATSSTIALVDLATGDTHEHVVPRVPVVVPLSWSADGTRLAYLGVRAVPDADQGVRAVPRAASGAPAGQLFVLDTRSARAVAVAGAEGVVAAAFSPDGTRLAYQEPGATVVHVVPVAADTATETAPDPGDAELPLSAGAVLADGPAWSPDGALLAVTTGAGTPSARIDFAAALPGRAVPAAVPGQDVLGWTGPATLVHGTAPTADTPAVRGDLVVERTDLRTGATETYLRVPTTRGQHPAGNLSLASALLARAVAAPAADADRGPWPLPARLALVLAAAALAVPATVGVRRRVVQLAALTAVPDWARDTTRG